MHNIGIIARHEYLTGLRRPSFIIMTLLIPLLGLFALAVSAFAGGQASSFMERQFGPDLNTIGLVDKTENRLFTPILPGYERRFAPYSDVAAGQEALKAGKIDVLLVFPTDYLQSGHITVMSVKDNFAISLIEDSARVNRFVVAHLLRNTTDAALRERLQNPVASAERLDANGKPVSTEGTSNFFIEFLLPYLVAIFLVVSIFSTAGFLLQGVAQEKSSRVIEIILSSVTAWELLIGKVVGLGLLGLTRVGFWIGSAFMLSQGAVSLLAVSLPVAGKPELFILSGVYYMLGFLLFSILMGTCGALGATQQEAQQIAGIFTLIAALPTWVGGFLFTNPNAPIARVLSWFPLTAPTMMMLRLPLGTIPPIDIVGSIAILVICIPAVTWLGSKLFRYGLLMYGKRPTLKQMVAIIRQG